MIIFRALAGIFAFWLLYMGIFAKRGLLDYRRMKQRNRELQLKISESQQRIKSLENQIGAFKTSSLEQERVIRERLGFVRPNESVVEFE